VCDLVKQFGGGNMRLTQCVRSTVACPDVRSISAAQAKCNCDADKYVEYELAIVVLDLILHRPQAYRHLLFNRSQMFPGFAVRRTASL
jgi:hypothetical protein